MKRQRERAVKKNDRLNIGKTEKNRKPFDIGERLKARENKWVGSCKK